ncbi:MAG: MFS transporter, partial [Opitutales bacterium]
MAKTGNRGVFGVIFLTIFIDMVGFSVIFPLFPAMLKYYLEVEEGGGLATSFAQIVNDFGISGQHFAGGFRIETVIFGGVLGSLFAVLQFIFAPMWGSLSDRIGRKRVLLVTVGLTSLGYLSWIFAGQFWVLIVSRILGGIASGNLSVATAAIADITPRQKRAKGMAIVGIAFGLGFVLGPAIGGFSALIDLTKGNPELAAIGLNPFSIPAIASFALALLNWGLVALAFRETLALEKRAKENERPSILQLGKVGNPSVRRTCLSYFWYMISFSGMEFTMTFLAVERFSYSPDQIAWLFVLIGCTLIFVQGFVVRRFAATVGEKKLAMSGIVVGAIAFIILSQAGVGSTPETISALSNAPLFNLGLILMSAGVALISPCLTAMTSLFSGDSQQGFHLGIFRSAGSLARAIGPLLAGI